jgi:acetyl esterase
MLDPQADALLKAMKPGQGVFDTDDPVEARRRSEATTERLAPPSPPLAKVEERDADGVPVRVYWPEAKGPLPVLVFFHGGGWVFGSRDTHDGICRHLAAKAPCLVVSVEYRLAPEHKFPAGVEDALAATKWVAANAAALGGDPKRLAVGGDSAGGNLAAVVALHARDHGGPAIAFQLLIYPAVDFTARGGSLDRFADGYFLTRDGIEQSKNYYLNGPADERDWRASPALAQNLAGLPPAYLFTAGFDPLLDEGRAFADKLRAAGVPVEYKCYDGMIHGFLRMGRVLDQALVALDESAAALRRALA